MYILVISSLALSKKKETCPNYDFEVVVFLYILHYLCCFQIFIIYDVFSIDRYNAIFVTVT